MFQDFNFKLVVIEALLDKEPLFLKKLKDLIENIRIILNGIQELNGVEIKAFRSVNFEISDLEKIESFALMVGMKFIIF